MNKGIKFTIFGVTIIVMLLALAMLYSKIQFDEYHVREYDEEKLTEKEFSPEAEVENDLMEDITSSVQEKSESEPEVNLTGQQTYFNEELGFSLEYSADKYGVSDVPRSGFDASFYKKVEGSGIDTAGIVSILHRKTEFQTFDEFSQDILDNYILDLLRSNSIEDREASDEEIKLKFGALLNNSNYTLDIENYNGVDVILHTRDFYGMFGNVREMFVWLGPGEYLTIGGAGIDDFDFTTIKLLDN